VTAKAGDQVDIWDNTNHFLARGYYNDKATIACRILTWDLNEQINETFFINRFNAALTLRKPFLTITNAYRLIFSEADNLPGLIVDVYDQVVVLQISTLGLEYLKNIIVSALVKVLDPVAIYEKSEGESREVEGLKPSSGLLWGELPTRPVEIYEGNAKFLVNIPAGQKTGFFLDQRANRLAITHYVKNKTVLNAFSYTGAFSAVLFFT
jgi:23S rRNA (cytosine1962-C5)-methyltransferase